jgi:hypothetical protein
MISAIRMTMTTARRKQKFVGVVVWGYGMRKRKILNKWRNENDSKTRKISIYLQC